jgi:acyl carrier protein
MSATDAEAASDGAWTEQFLGFLVEHLQVLEPNCEFGGLGLDSELASLGVDSLSLLAALAAIEDRYGVRIPDSELATLSTVVDLADRVAARMTNRQQATLATHRDLKVAPNKSGLS